MQEVQPYVSKNKIRIVTAASLFDGHDVAINIMRRIMQSSGAEIIHLGHNRSVEEIVHCAIQEDAQAIAITSYQGGHMEYFKYMYDLLQEKGSGHIKLFGGGGGVILPEEIKELHEYGIARIYSPDDGREMGLQGMINDVLKQSDYSLTEHLNGELTDLKEKNPGHIARIISVVENEEDFADELIAKLGKKAEQVKSPVLGITGTGGAGKSTTVDELIRRFLIDFKDKSIAIISVDPTKRKTGGALLGDRIRMNSIDNPRVYMRSLATRGANLSLSKHITDVITILKAAKYDLIVLESSGIGQSDSEITNFADVSMYVMTPEYGAASQLEKIDMLDFADIVVLNKFDKRGGMDALRDVKKQYQRNHGLWSANVDDMPIFGTIASQFNDPGVNRLYGALVQTLNVKTEVTFESNFKPEDEVSEKNYIIPPERVRYLSEISENNRKYDEWVEEQATLAQRVWALKKALEEFEADSHHERVMNKPELAEKRKDLRKNPTKAEYAFWQLVKNRHFEKKKFRRQHSIGNYIIDFYCPELALAVEIDGGYNLLPEQREADTEKDEYLKRNGIKTVRFKNEEVLQNPEGVITHLKRFVNPPRSPLARGEEKARPPLVRGEEKGDQKSGQLNETWNDRFALSLMENQLFTLHAQLHPDVRAALENWDTLKEAYKNEEYAFKVRDKEIRIKTHTESLSGSLIPKITFPKYEAWGDIFRWVGQENLPGRFPYTAGVYPFKRTGEDPTRQFAGEGGPERTNKRFHYLSLDMPAKRLSTAFDSVTLYGEDPDLRPDIYGKIGNAGVSIWSLDAMKKLYSGFDLTNKATSVSMTINGPAATIMAFFLNTAIDQQCERYIREHGLEDEVQTKIKKLFKAAGLDIPTYQGSLPEGNDGLGLMLLGISGDQVLPADVYEKIKAETISQVRGTVQADILKEDQAQNTCIFSTDFSLKLMGDVQEYFNQNKVRNFYSVSISGYHIAEAGANPITQLAFTLANGFTYVEYYLSRGMNIDDFAPNLSFFFSNGIDPEYAVIGRVARRIWSKAMKYKYGANERSQKLKYHIQTSGRSLHAQEIQFNDIRTTLQALYAIYDNCNSLHTNAYDEAITTPTEESVRRAMAIQLIINKELGLNKNENPLQGSFIIEELTDLVEEAVLLEFDRITERGGVLGAMETMYQRGKIQEESMYYEMKKHTGELPIIGVNTFLSSKGSPTSIPREVIRSTREEKDYQIQALNAMHSFNKDKAAEELRKIQLAAINNENIFTQLMEAVKYCSLGQITNALFDVGGKYRRNM